MLLTFATLAVLAFCISIGIVGGVLLWRGQSGWRALGGVLLIQGVLATAALIALSTVPFGIGEPLIRVPLVEMVMKALCSLAVMGCVATMVSLMARGSRVRPSRGRRGRRRAAAGLLIGVPLVAVGSMAGLVRASTLGRERERDPNKRPITLSRGFASNIFVQG